jgi:hypothetical protein
MQFVLFYVVWSGWVFFEQPSAVQFDTFNTMEQCEQAKKVISAMRTAYCKEVK